MIYILIYIFIYLNKQRKSQAVLCYRLFQSIILHVRLIDKRRQIFGYNY